MSEAHAAPTGPERPCEKRLRSNSVSAHGGGGSPSLSRPALLTRASPARAGPTASRRRRLHSPTDQLLGLYVPSAPYGDAVVAAAGRDVRARPP